MEPKPTKRFYVFLPWILTFILFGALAVFSYYRGGHGPFVIEFIKDDLLSTMRIHLLEASEAEKNAVLATTDEASESFAGRARQAVDEVESSRKRIESILLKEKRPEETEIFNEFNICWSQFRKLDETILALATQNTNLKAQKLSATQGTQEMERFEQSLNRLIHRNTNNKCNEVVMLSYEALTAGLKIFTLHKPHIEEASDQEMDKIELSIKTYDTAARKALGALRSIAYLSDNEDLNNAETAYEQFMNLTSEVLRLSRINTNIKSAELSSGKKGLISSRCQDILASLQKTVQAQRSNAIR
ncbi:MAG: MCP four helix bundle domain-containing protein [Methylobacter sp.]